MSGMRVHVKETGGVGSVLAEEWDDMGLSFKVHLDDDTVGWFRDVSVEEIEEYAISLDKSGGRRLGINVDPIDGCTLRIESIEDGLVEEWNLAHPTQTVRRGDRIYEINSIHCDALQFVEECKRNEVLRMKLWRPLAQAYSRCGRCATPFVSADDAFCGKCGTKRPAQCAVPGAALPSDTGAAPPPAALPSREVSIDPKIGKPPCDDPNCGCDDDADCGSLPNGVPGGGNAKFVVRVDMPIMTRPGTKPILFVHDEIRSIESTVGDDQQPAFTVLWDDIKATKKFKAYYRARLDEDGLVYIDVTRHLQRSF